MASYAAKQACLLVHRDSTSHRRNRLARPSHQVSDGERSGLPVPAKPLIRGDHRQFGTIEHRRINTNVHERCPVDTSALRPTPDDADKLRLVVGVRPPPDGRTDDAAEIATNDSLIGDMPRQRASASRQSGP